MAEGEARADGEARGGEPGKITAFDFLTRLASLVALFYAFLFFCGWVYMVSLYGEFDVELWTLDVPVYDFRSESPIALQSILGRLVILFAVIISIKLLISAVNDSSPKRPWVATVKRQLERFQTDLRRAFYGIKIPRTLALIFVALGIFLFTFLIANTAGLKQGRRLWNGSPHVHLSFKAADRQPQDLALLKANDGNRLSLLTETKDLVVVFEGQRQGASGRNVFVLARSDLASVRIWR